MLGKRLGKEMAAVAKAVAAMTSAQVAEYEANGTVRIGGVQLHAGEIKVRRCMSAPVVLAFLHVIVQVAVAAVKKQHQGKGQSMAVKAADGMEYSL